MNLPVNAYVVDEIVVAPSVLAMVDAAEPRPVSFFVWRPDRKPLGQPLSISVPPGYRVTHETGQALHRCRFTVVRDGEQEATDPVNKSVRVRFDPKLTVEVPIRSISPAISLTTEGVEND